MSQTPQLDIVVCDPIITNNLPAFSPSRRRLQNSLPTPSSSRSLIINTPNKKKSTGTMDSEGARASQDETMPLLGGVSQSQSQHKKPFYRARPLWLVPFAITASLVRGMTLAPRVEVYTQLSCNQLYGRDRFNHTQGLTVFNSFNNTAVHLNAAFYSSLDPIGPHFLPLTYPSQATSGDAGGNGDDDTEDPRNLPSSRCLSDPAVQAGAARLQTMMTTTMGLLSALTTGWWGQFGERNGRTKVLAIATFGLFLTDLMFIGVSTPSSPLSQHGHKLLLITPVIEGLLGGWTTLQSATSAYISDCTSPGSRAQIFSRFSGAFYIGFCIGPSIGGYLIQHPFSFMGHLGVSGPKSVTCVFWTAIVFSFTNFILVLFVFPESTTKEKRAKALGAHLGPGKGKARVSADDASGNDNADDSEGTESGVIARFLKPLAVFLPVVVMDPSGFGRKKKDWNLTILAVAALSIHLAGGVYQIKYLYAAHVYGWGAERLSYYISWVGGLRAIFLLFILPAVVTHFKPKPKLSIKGKSKATSTSSGTPCATPILEIGKKPKPTLAQLRLEIAFDTLLAKCAASIDILSNFLVCLVPAPSYQIHSASLAQQHPLESHLTAGQSEAMFVASSSLTSFGSGALPALHSLALCILQVRSLNAAAATNNRDSRDSLGHDAVEAGTLFGALAVLQAVGASILGPMIFGLVYSGTVAKFPKAVFALACCVLVAGFAFLTLVRNPVPKPELSIRTVMVKGKNGKVRRLSHVERGRSTISKDLRGGAVSYYSAQYGSMDVGPQYLPHGEPASPASSSSS